MKKLNRAAVSTLGVGLLSGLILSVGCSPTPGPADGSGGIVGTGGVSGTGALPGGGGPGVGGGGPGVGGGGPGVGGGGPNGTGGAPGVGGTPGTGGGVTTEGEPIPKPLLITSAVGAFWKTDVDPTPGTGTATVTVDPAAELQSWVGWGGTFNEVGWNELMKLDATERDAIMKLLFSKVDGLGLTWGPHSCWRERLRPSSATRSAMHLATRRTWTRRFRSITTKTRTTASSPSSRRPRRS